MTDVLIKKRNLDRCNYRNTWREDNLKTHREKAACYQNYLQTRNAKDFRRTQKARRCEEGLSPELLERAQPRRHPTVGRVDSGALRK